MACDSVSHNYRVESHKPLGEINKIEHRGYRDDQEQKQPWNLVLDLLKESNERTLKESGDLYHIVTSTSRFEACF